VSITVLAPRRYRVEGAGVHEIELLPGSGEHEVRCRIEGREHGAVAAFDGDCLHVKLGARDLSVREDLYAPPASERGGAAAGRELRAPMNGKVVAVLAAEGDAVEKGQRLVVVEAMKMQHEIAAQVAGRVARLPVKPGDQVATRQLLVEIEPAA
jgi:geranyl-CoA carboxylase alpha subunit